MTAHLPAWVYGQDRRLFSTGQLDRTSLYDVLENKLGIELWLATETVEAQRAGTDARLLDVSPEDLLLVVERHTTDPARQSVEYTRLRYRADLYRYQAQLYRRGSLPVPPSAD
jgi:DNA-binding GntR family transcriptional regulator